MAFNKDLRLLKNKRKYKNPDAINNQKLELKRYLPNIGQIDGVKRISQYMDIDKNTSYSFRIFIQGVLAFCNNEA